METSEVPADALQLMLPSGGSWDHRSMRPGSGVAGWTRNTWGLSVSWVIGLPRRAGARLHASNDAEARWWHWEVTECKAGLGRHYRDARFALPGNPALSRGERGDGLACASPAPPGCQHQEER